MWGVLSRARGQEKDEWFRNEHSRCTALVVGSDDVAPSYSVGVLTRRQVDRRGGSRGAREVASD